MTCKFFLHSFWHSLEADKNTSSTNRLCTISIKLCCGACFTPTWSPLRRFSCLDRVEELGFEELLDFEDVFDLGFDLGFVLCLADVLALVVDAVGLAEEPADLADVIGLAVPPEVNADVGFCLALVPRLAEDMVMIRVRRYIDGDLLSSSSSSSWEMGF